MADDGQFKNIAFEGVSGDKDVSANFTNKGSGACHHSKGVFVNPVAVRQTFLLTFLFFAFSVTAVAQGGSEPVPGKSAAKATPEAPKSAAPASASQPATVGLSADDVVAMVKAGLSEKVIVMAIRREEKAFGLSALQLVQLKLAGVSDNVLMVMLDPKAELDTATPTPTGAQPGRPPETSQAVVVPGIGLGIIPVGSPIHSNPSGATPAPGTANTASVDVNNPDAPHDSGIYLFTVKNDVPRMTMLERAAYQGGKSGGMFTSALTGGIKKVKWKAVLPGRRAALRTTERRPVFYFYFDDKAAGLGKTAFGASNPNQFALISLTVKSRARETIVGQSGAFGRSSGTHEKSMRAFRSERLRPGMYRVIPMYPLEPGEYCFLASGLGGGMMGPGGAGASTAADTFDFSIIPAE